MNSWARRLLKAALGIVIGYVIIVIGVWTLQSQLIYHPDRRTPPPAVTVLPTATDIELRTDDGLTLAAWWVAPVGGTDRGQAVLAAPGNGGNRAGRAPLAQLLAEQGFHVLLLEYRGYGGNPGAPSEAGLAADARAAQAAISDRGFDLAHTIFFGESLGTGVVSRLQVTHPPAAVVLREPCR